MDIKVGLSIFNTPWMIEPQIGLNLFDYWLEMRHSEGAWKDKYRSESQGESFYQISQKLFNVSNNVVVAPNNTFDLASFEGFDGASVAIIALEGVMMKSNFCGELGTAAIASLVRMAARTPSVKSIVLLIDSPGGSVSGTENLANEIRNAGKQTIAIADGYACSAAYWIGCSADRFYAAGRTTIIGSIGTMASWVDNTEAMKKEGYVLREYYATRSKEKNLAFREANNGDGKRLIQESLNPLNEEFIAWVESRRPAIKEGTLTGTTMLATAAVDLGLIDAIQSVNDIIEDLIHSHQSQKTTTKMTPFQQVLVAANAESFPVVDGGFLLSEEQLSSLNSRLAQDAVSMRTLTTRVAALEANEAQASTASEQLAALQQQLEAKTAELASAQDNLAKANAELAEEKRKPGADFSKVKTEEERRFNPEGQSFEEINAAFEAEAAKRL